MPLRGSEMNSFSLVGRRLELTESQSLKFESVLKAVMQNAKITNAKQ